MDGDDGLDALCMALEEEDRHGSSCGQRSTVMAQLQKDSGRSNDEVMNNTNNNVKGVSVAALGPVVRVGLIPTTSSKKSQENGLGSLAKEHALRVASGRKGMNSTKVENRFEGRSEQRGRRIFSDIGQGAVIERCSGLKIRDALVSSAQVQSLLGDTSFIKLDQMRSRVIQDTVPKRWCTIGVVGEVSAPRTTEGQSQYVIWKLTDLNETMILLYVFGNAYHDLRDDVMTGSLVCVVSGKTRRAGDGVTMSIFEHSQLTVLGRSADFGYCSSKRKDGQPCRIPVNVNKCEYCSYHVGSAFKKIGSLRQELQGGSLKSAFARKSSLKWTVGKFEKKESGGVSKSLKKEDLQRAAEKTQARGMGSMGSKYLVTCADPVKALQRKKEEESVMRKTQASAALGSSFFDKAPIPAKHNPHVCVPRGTRNIGKDAPNTENSFSGSKKNITSLAGRSLISGESVSMVQLSDDDVPVAGSCALDLTSSLPARAKAVALLKNKKLQQRDQDEAAAEMAPFLALSLKAHQKTIDSGPAVATEPVAPMQNTNSSNNRKKRAAVEHHQQPKAPPSAFESMFGDIINEMKSKAGETDKVQSRFKDVVDAADNHELMQRLDTLQKKDDMVQKMDSVKSKKVKAYKCSSCSVILFRKHEKCLREHPQAISQVYTVQRWWKCSDCSKVFSTLGVNYPTGPCIKCNSNQAHFEKHSMLMPMSKTREDFLTEGVACKENLLPRGREQKWVNE